MLMDDKERPRISTNSTDFEEARKTFITILENEYMGGATGKTPIETYPCECKYDPETQTGACGEDCINRMLCIECKDCSPGKYCQNRRFQRYEYAPLEVFKTEKKGFGVRTSADLMPGQFVIEYCGEVIPKALFLKRTQEYSQNGVKHFYFMSLKSDEMIDAQKKGNISRFINHSCNASCELQKWTVNSRVRMGIFAKRFIPAGEELTFDYKFERYGAEAQPCFCGEPICKGVIGNEKRSGIADYDDDDDDMTESTLDDVMTEDVLPVVPKIESVDEVSNFIIAILGTTKIARVKKLLRKLEATENPSILKKFVHLQGLRALKNALTLFGRLDLPLFYQILKIFKSLPVPSRNLIMDCKVEETVSKLISDVTDQEMLETGKEVLDNWSKLPLIYKIPKRSKSESESDAGITANGFQSKRQMDDDNSGAEKRPKLEDTDEHTPVYSGGLYKKDVDLSRTSSNAYEYSSNRYDSEPRSRNSFSSSGSRRYSDHNYSNGYGKTNSSQDLYASKSETKNKSSSDSDKTKLLPNWKSATAADGSVYYYNVETRQTQWDPPVANDQSVADVKPTNEETELLNGASGRSIVPGLTEQSLEKIIEEANANVAAQRKLLEASKKSSERKSSKSEKLSTKSKLDASSEKSTTKVKKDGLKNSQDSSSRTHSSKADSKEVLKFRKNVSEIVIKTLSKYKQDMDTETFKQLARKLTHSVVEKERKQHESLEQYAVNIPDDVKRKIKKLVHTKVGGKKDNNVDVDPSLIAEDYEYLEME